MKFVSFCYRCRQDDHFVNTVMLFTLYYAYATIMQWWRLSTLRNKLNGTLTAQNALLICSSNTYTSYIHDSRNVRSLENLLFRSEDRIACTVVPKVIMTILTTFCLNFQNFYGTISRYCCSWFKFIAFYTHSSIKIYTRRDLNHLS